MIIFGTPTQQDSDDKPATAAELKRIGLHAQRNQMAVDHKDERGEYPFTLFGTGELCINLPGQEAHVMLERREFAALFTFLQQPHVVRMALAILRADLREHCPGGAELLDDMLKLPDEHKQAILWAFGRAEKPAFMADLDA